MSYNNGYWVELIYHFLAVPSALLNFACALFGKYPIFAFELDYLASRQVKRMLKDCDDHDNSLKQKLDKVEQELTQTLKESDETPN